MRTLLAAAVVSLCACGAETAGTAATSAAIKKQELEQGKKAMEQAQQKVEQAVQLQQTRTEAASQASDK